MNKQGINLMYPPHPSLLPPGEKELFAPSPLRGEGWGEGDFIISSKS
jgi:hypothetical protein